MNLIANSQQALADFNGPRSLAIRTTFSAADRMVHLTVADSGPGVPPDIRLRIFEPFFTTKPMGVGTGIGLAVCQSVITSHGGTIAVEDTEGGGASFIIHLPIEKASAAEIPGAATANVPAPRLLVVAGEKDVADALADILGNAGYRVDIVESGRIGLERIAGGDYDLVVSDAHLDDLDGLTFYGRLRDLKPAMAERLILVADDITGALGRLMADARVRCIEKPFIPEHVRRIASEVTGRGIDVSD